MSDVIETFKGPVGNEREKSAEATPKIKMKRSKLPRKTLDKKTQNLHFPAWTLSSLFGTFLVQIPDGFTPPQPSFLIAFLLVLTPPLLTAKPVETGEGLSCGSGQLYIVVQNRMQCTDCNAGQYYNKQFKKCMDCGPNFTNSKRNVRSSCKDLRIPVQESTYIDNGIGEIFSTASVKFKSKIISLTTLQPNLKRNTGGPEQLTEGPSLVKIKEKNVELKVPETDFVLHEDQINKDKEKAGSATLGWPLIVIICGLVVMVVADVIFLKPRLQQTKL